MTARFASLPMYDLPELREATDALWGSIAGRLIDAGVDDVPGALSRSNVADLMTHHWRHPGLLLSQSCGWPVAALLAGDVAVVGAFSYVGVSDGDCRYASHLVVRADDTVRPLSGRAIAVNGYDSLSGWISLVSVVDELGPVLITGSHVESLGAVQDGRADLACVDSVTWALLAGHRPSALDGLAIAGAGPLVPCLPLITHPTLGPGIDVLRAALHGVRSDPLLIEGFIPLDAADYAPVLGLVTPSGTPVARRPGRDQTPHHS